jgi:high-affinity iron transporter
MKKILVWAAAGLLIGATLTCSPSASDASDAGKSLYNQKCAFCHGVQGDGNGPAGAALSPGPTDFTNPQYWQTASNQKITATILNGEGVMPAFDLPAPQLQALIEYLKTFKK